MEIAFLLTGRHAEWLLDLYAATQEYPGPRFNGPSDMVRRVIEDLLDAEAGANGANGYGHADLYH